MSLDNRLNRPDAKDILKTTLQLTIGRPSVGRISFSNDTDTDGEFTASLSPVPGVDSAIITTDDKFVQYTGMQPPYSMGSMFTGGDDSLCSFNLQSGAVVHLYVVFWSVQLSLFDSGASLDLSLTICDGEGVPTPLPITLNPHPPNPTMETTLWVPTSTAADPAPLPRVAVRVNLEGRPALMISPTWTGHSLDVVGDGPADEKNDVVASVIFGDVTAKVTRVSELSVDVDLTVNQRYASTSMATWALILVTRDMNIIELIRVAIKPARRVDIKAVVGCTTMAELRYRHSGDAITCLIESIPDVQIFNKVTNQPIIGPFSLDRDNSLFMDVRHTMLQPGHQWIPIIITTDDGTVVYPFMLFCTATLPSNAVRRRFVVNLSRTSPVKKRFTWQEQTPTSPSDIAYVRSNHHIMEAVAASPMELADGGLRKYAVGVRFSKVEGTLPMTGELNLYILVRGALEQIVTFSLEEG